MGRKFGFSFSWKRALGISAFKGKISRIIGIPLTKSGRQRKAGRLLGDIVGSALIAGTELANKPAAPSVRTPHPPNLPATFTFAWPNPINANASADELALGPEALKLAIEKPRGWEYLLFARVMLDETRKAKRHLARGNTTPPDPSDIHSMAEFLDWTSARLGEYELLLDRVGELSITNDNPAFGPPGQPGNVPAIVSLSRQVGYCCQRAADWSQEIAKTPMPLVFHDVARELQRFAEAFVESAERFAKNFLQQVEDATTKPPGSQVVIDATLRIDPPDRRGFESALQTLKTQMTPTQQPVSEADATRAAIASIRETAAHGAPLGSLLGKSMLDGGGRVCERCELVFNRGISRCARCGAPLG